MLFTSVVTTKCASSDYNKNADITSLFENSTLETIKCPTKTIYIQEEMCIFVCKSNQTKVVDKLKKIKEFCSNIKHATHVIIDEKETIDIDVLQAVLKGLFIYKDACKWFCVVVLLVS